MKIMRGRVEAVSNGGVHVIIPEYDDDEPFGPLESMMNQTSPTYAKGDRVLVAQVSKVKEDLVVLGKVTGL